MPSSCHVIYLFFWNTHVPKKLSSKFYSNQMPLGSGSWLIKQFEIIVSPIPITHHRCRLILPMPPGNNAAIIVCNANSQYPCEE